MKRRRATASSRILFIVYFIGTCFFILLSIFLLLSYSFLYSCSMLQQIKMDKPTRFHSSIQFWRKTMVLSFLKVFAFLDRSFILSHALMFFTCYLVFCLFSKFFNSVIVVKGFVSDTRQEVLALGDAHQTSLPPKTSSQKVKPESSSK